jgi:hypothetical protein
MCLCGLSSPAGKCRDGQNRILSLSKAADPGNGSALQGWGNRNYGSNPLRRCSNCCISDSSRPVFPLICGLYVRFPLTFYWKNHTFPLEKLGGAYDQSERGLTSRDPGSLGS